MESALTPIPIRSAPAALASDLIWGADAIGAEIGQTRRQTQYLLETGRLPASKVGGRWLSSRAALSRFFAARLGGEIA